MGEKRGMTGGRSGHDNDSRFVIEDGLNLPMPEGSGSPQLRHQLWECGRVNCFFSRFTGLAASYLRYLDTVDPYSYHVYAYCV